MFYHTLQGSTPSESHHHMGILVRHLIQLVAEVLEVTQLATATLIDLLMDGWNRRGTIQIHFVSSKCINIFDQLLPKSGPK